jgi:ribosomal protein L18E
MLAQNEQPAEAPPEAKVSPRVTAGVRSLSSGSRKRSDDFRKQIAEALALAQRARRYSENPETD